MDNQKIRKILYGLQYLDSCFEEYNKLFGIFRTDFLNANKLGILDLKELAIKEFGCTSEYRRLVLEGINDRVYAHTLELVKTNLEHEFFNIQTRVPNSIKESHIVATAIKKRLTEFNERERETLLTKENFIESEYQYFKNNVESFIRENSKYIPDFNIKKENEYWKLSEPLSKHLITIGYHFASIGINSYSELERRLRFDYAELFKFENYTIPYNDYEIEKVKFKLKYFENIEIGYSLAIHEKYLFDLRSRQSFMGVVSERHDKIKWNGTPLEFAMMFKLLKEKSFIYDYTESKVFAELLLQCFEVVSTRTKKPISLKTLENNLSEVHSDLIRELGLENIESSERFGKKS